MDSFYAEDTLYVATYGDRSGGRRLLALGDGTRVRLFEPGCLMPGSVTATADTANAAIEVDDQSLAEYLSSTNQTLKMNQY